MHQSMLRSLVANDPALTELSFTGSFLDDDDAEDLAEAIGRGNNQLRTLSLDVNSITCKGVSRLAPLLSSNTTNLTFLDLHRNQIGDRGCVALANRLNGNQKLLYLNLSANSIGDMGASSLVKTLSTNPALTHLDICDNGLSKAAMMTLVATLGPNHSLVQLRVQQAEPDDVIKHWLYSILIELTRDRHPRAALYDHDETDDKSSSSSSSSRGSHNDSGSVVDGSSSELTEAAAVHHHPDGSLIFPVVVVQIIVQYATGDMLTDAAFIKAKQRWIERCHERKDNIFK